MLHRRLVPLMMEFLLPRAFVAATMKYSPMLDGHRRPHHHTLGPLCAPSAYRPLKAPASCHASPAVCPCLVASLPCSCLYEPRMQQREWCVRVIFPLVEGQGRTVGEKRLGGKRGEGEARYAEKLSRGAFKASLRVGHQSPRIPLLK